MGCAALSAQAAPGAQDAGVDEPVAPPSVAPDGHVYFVSRLTDLDFVTPRQRGDGIPTGTRSDVYASESKQGVSFPDGVFFSAGPGGNQFSQRAIIEGPGSCVVAPRELASRWRTNRSLSATLALRLPAARDVAGRLFVPNDDWSGQLAVDFVVPAEALRADARGEWLQVVADTAAAHLRAEHTGAAWFRHQRSAALKTLEQAAPELTQSADRRDPSGSASLQGSFELFSGGRALSENLALDRLLPFAADAEADVPIDDIPGLSALEYDWSALIEGLEPARDPLAALMPADQHALLFPSFEALVAVTDQLDDLLAPLGRLSERRAESAHTRQRYEQQLGLPMSDLARLLGPHLIASVALTGGDSYLRTGSDIALLFEPREAHATLAAIQARVQLALAGRPGVEALSGEIEGLAYTGLADAERSVCSYVAALDGAVVVTNSRAQLARLARVGSGLAPALDSLPEYTFFRDRYRLGAPGESALLILSDATIRRWCGPRLRIGESRRARAAALLSEVTARLLDADRAPPDPAVSIPAPDDLPDVGALTMLGTRLRSASYGSLAFATPISELDLELVTEEEEAFYTRWLRGYEDGWREVFDPIAVRFDLSAGEIKADVTVRPLMADSDYERFVELARGGSIAPRSGDLHPGTMLQYSVALGSRQLSMMSETALLKVLAPGVDIFGWIGGSLSLSIDDTAFWDELAASEQPEDYALEHMHQLPVALQVEVGNGLKLAVFLTTMRGLVESSAPGTTVWENREHEGISYVRVGNANDAIPEDFAIYYSTGPEHLTLSPNEGLIHAAIDRRLARAAAKQAGTTPAVEREAPWLGEHLGLRVDVQATLARYDSRIVDLQRGLRLASWSNLPILNEWQRRFPDADPALTHQRWFARQPVCPSGGEYRWNEAWQTMESTLYGHPGAPLDGPDLPSAAAAILYAQLGATFEHDGLRARVALTLSEDHNAGAGGER
ncbi:MAG: hypothetical protein DRQ55_11140 [Planctomycetota bacterium]|nr:MAG: hypothetical protein DRQ55_11140 [Planctomycetota bacterium]